MPSFVIPVHLGRVTSRDASKYVPGELLLAQDAMYKIGDPGIWKVPGRVAFNATAEANAIIQCEFLEYDGTDPDLFIALIKEGLTIRWSTAGASGTWADLEMPNETSRGTYTFTTSPTTMDVVHYNNVHYVLLGMTTFNTLDADTSAGYTTSIAAQNLAIPATSARTAFENADGSITLHGMRENQESHTVTDTGTGTGFTLTSGVDVIYWIEERVKSGTTVVKRSPSTSTYAVTLTGDGTLVKPVFNRVGPITNPEATHWAVMATAAAGSFPTGAEIGEVDITETTLEDTRTGTDPAIPGGAVYETDIATIAGITSSVSKWGTPPIATTGDVFEDSIVTNDIWDPRAVRYSFPDEPHAFPAHNRIPFETKAHDEVVYIRRIGNVIVAVLRYSAWRINTLPRSDDSAFDIERAKDEIEGAHGIVSARAGTTFSFGRGMRIACVTQYGIEITDGARWDVLTDDMDWENEVEVSQLGKCILRNNPRYWRLEFYYPKKGNQKNDSIAYLHYHPSHAKTTQAGDFRAKVTWPIHGEAECAMLARLDDGAAMFTGHRTGVLYRENFGLSDGSNSGGIDFQVRTGDVALNDAASESEIIQMMTHHSIGAPTQVAKMVLVQRNKHEDDVTVTDENVSLARREATSGVLEGAAEMFQFGMENSDSLGQFRVDEFRVETREPSRSEQ